MRRVVWLALLSLLAGCGDGCGGAGLRPTDAQVRVVPEVQLGRPFVGDRAEATLPITAISDGVVRVLSVTTTHPQLVLEWGAQPGGVSIARGATLGVTVAWTPIEPGPIEAIVEVEVDVEGAPRHSVRVLGEARAVPDCDDQNPCTDDGFDRSSEQCTRTFHERACDDGNACTQDDQCRAGVCRGSGVTCADGNLCTQDLCDPTVGCVFPPDDTRCDDGDPCTDDLCDPAGGCLREPNTGNSCGDVSCAAAYFCVAGTCQAVDISGSSDGFACDDGNYCTENDHCLAGKCEGGSFRAHDPEIVATLDTYGGDYASVTTDGYRYVFVDSTVNRMPNDRTSFLVTVFDGTQLVPHGGLSLQSTAAPVFAAPGFVAVPVDNRIVMVDVTDVDHPSIVWDKPLSPMPNARLLKLARMQFGLLAHVVETGSQPSTPSVIFLPLPTPQTPGRPKTMTQTYFSDMDADGDAYVVLTAVGALWVQMGATGQDLAAAVMPVDSGLQGRVSMHDGVVAILRDETLTLFRVGNSAPFASIRADDATDVALVGSTVFTAQPEISALKAQTIDDILNGVGLEFYTSAVGARTLERGDGHLLLSGDLALPLKLTAGSAGREPTPTRVTGVGHGQASVLTNGPNGRVLVGSSNSTGEIDLGARAISDWSISERGPFGASAHFLKGATRNVPINRRVWLGDGAWVGWGMSWYQGTSPNAEEFRLDGLVGGVVDFTADRAWATTVIDRPRPGDPSFDRYGIRMWDTRITTGTHLATIDDPMNWQSVAVRASDDLSVVGWLSHVPGPAQSLVPFLQLVNAKAPGIQTIGAFPIEEGSTSWITMPESYAVDPSAAIIADRGRVQLHPLSAATGTQPPMVPAGTLPSVTLQNALPAMNQVLWMKDGHAWVGWEAQVQTSTSTAMLLSDFHYDASTNLLQQLGDVVMPGRVTGVYQADDYAVAATSTAVVVVSPACR